MRLQCFRRPMRLFVPTKGDIVEILPKSHRLQDGETWRGRWKSRFLLTLPMWWEHFYSFKKAIRAFLDVETGGFRWYSLPPLVSSAKNLGRKLKLPYIFSVVSSYRRVISPSFLTYCLPCYGVFLPSLVAHIARARRHDVSFWRRFPPSTN